MRQKDFEEIARVLGNEVRTAPKEEFDGLTAAFHSLVGHAQHVYPDVDQHLIHKAYQEARAKGM